MAGPLMHQVTIAAPANVFFTRSWPASSSRKAGGAGPGSQLQLARFSLPHLPESLPDRAARASLVRSGPASSSPGPGSALLSSHLYLACGDDP